MNFSPNIVGSNMCTVGSMSGGTACATSLKSRNLSSRLHSAGSEQGARCIFMGYYGPEMQEQEGVVGDVLAPVLRH